jgi:hypothetical protein
MDTAGDVFQTGGLAAQGRGSSQQHGEAAKFSANISATVRGGWQEAA